VTNCERLTRKTQERRYENYEIFYIYIIIDD